MPRMKSNFAKVSNFMDFKCKQIDNIIFTKKATEMRNHKPLLISKNTSSRAHLNNVDATDGENIVVDGCGKSEARKNMSV